MSQFIAFDLGAESGRSVLGRFHEGRLSIQETHRFPTGGVEVSGTLYWDIWRLFQDMCAGLTRSVQVSSGELRGIGVDTWGVDFGLLDGDGRLLSNPVHYRDTRTDGMMEKVFGIVPRREIFELTGLQFMKINSLYQLFAMVDMDSPLLPAAEKMLMIPDLLNYFFTGRKVGEFTDATTTQAWNPRANDWARDMLEKLGIPTHIFPEVIPPGSVVDTLLPSIADSTGAGRIPVIAPATHDTGSAVAAVPAEDNRWAYISCGTWSLLGAEVPEPMVTDKVLEHSFSNEGGVEGTYLLLRNYVGMWPLQECRRYWENQGESVDYRELVRKAENAPAFACFIDPENPLFFEPGEMPTRIVEFCQTTGQARPEGRGGIVRCILESLALTYRNGLRRLEQVKGHSFDVLHIVGGGSRNRLLCQWCANAMGIPVIGGPAEATAVGNLCVQAMGVGVLASLAEMRRLIRDSFDVVTYEPQNRDQWEEANARFTEIAEKSEGDWVK